MPDELAEINAAPEWCYVVWDHAARCIHDGRHYPTPEDVRDALNAAAPHRPAGYLSAMKLPRALVLAALRYAVIASVVDTPRVDLERRQALIDQERRRLDAEDGVTGRYSFLTGRIEPLELTP